MIAGYAKSKFTPFCFGQGGKLLFWTQFFLKINQNV